MMHIHETPFVIILLCVTASATAYVATEVIRKMIKEKDGRE